MATEQSERAGAGHFDGQTPTMRAIVQDRYGESDVLREQPAAMPDEARGIGRKRARERRHDGGEDAARALGRIHRHRRLPSKSPF